MLENRYAATVCLHTPPRACNPPKPAVSLGREGTVLQSTAELGIRVPAETVWQLHLACMLQGKASNRLNWPVRQGPSTSF